MNSCRIFLSILSHQINAQRLRSLGPVFHQALKDVPRERTRAAPGGKRLGLDRKAKPSIRQEASHFNEHLRERGRRILSRDSRGRRLKQTAQAKAQQTFMENHRTHISTFSFYAAPQPIRGRGSGKGGGGK